MKKSTAWIWVAAFAAWSVLWGVRGGLPSVVAMMHWPVAWILLAGYVFNLKGGIAAAALAAVLVVVHKFFGTLDSWTLIAWQVLVYWLFGLYPFKFMQIREQRQHHYATLITYKHGETETLKAKLAEAERKCEAIEKRLRNLGGKR